MVSQKDISKIAGVSQKTISLYFLHPEKIAPDTRERIRKAVDDAKYFPNLAARTMRNRRFNRIACVVPQNGMIELYPQSHLLAYLNGIAMELANYDFSLVYVPVFLYDAGKPIVYHEFFSSISADGIIGIPGKGMPNEIDEKMNNLGLPVLWLNRPAEDGIVTIEYDETAGIADFAEYARRMHLRTCGWFGPKYGVADAHYTSKLRFEAVCSELGKRGCAVTKKYFTEHRESVMEAAERFLHSLGDEIPEITVCYNSDYYSFLERCAGKSADSRIRRMELIYFASSHEYHYLREYRVNQIRIPEFDMGRLGAKTIYSVLNGDPVKQLDPLPTVFAEFGKCGGGE